MLTSLLIILIISVSFFLGFAVGSCAGVNKMFRQIYKFLKMINPTFVNELYKSFEKMFYEQEEGKNYGKFI